MVSWADAQESDEEMVGTDETSKRQKVQVIEAALQVVWHLFLKHLLWCAPPSSWSCDAE